MNVGRLIISNSSILESQISEESDDEERLIKFIDKKMRLCFVDIAKRNSNEKNALAKGMC